MKITNENIDKLGIKLEIEVPDEIKRDGIFYEGVKIGYPKTGDMCCSVQLNIGHVYDKWEERNPNSFLYLILREIPRPTREWLDKRSMVASEKPVVCAEDDIVFQEGEIWRVCEIDEHLISKRRYHLTERKKEFKKEWVCKFQCKFYHRSGCTSPDNSGCDNICCLKSTPIPEPERRTLYDVMNEVYKDIGINMGIPKDMMTEPEKEVHTSCEGCDSHSPHSSTDNCFGCSVLKHTHTIEKTHWTPITKCPKCGK